MINILIINTFTAGPMQPKITKEELYDLYVTKNIGTPTIGKTIKMSPGTINNYLRKYDIPIRKSGAKIKYVANHDFFSNWSEDMAYCLGFIAADGHVWKERPFITIGIHKKDTEILEFIRNCISPDTLLRVGSGNNVQICVYSRQIHEDLNRLGIDHSKTFNLKLPNIPNKYIRHFVRGFFDGDGSIWKSRGGFKGSIVSASQQILIDIQQFLSFGRIRSFRKKYFSLDFNRSELLKLREIMYNECNFKLKRKYDKFFLINEDYKWWTQEEINILIENKNQETNKIMKLLPNRSRSSINVKRREVRKFSETTQNS